MLNPEECRRQADDCIALANATPDPRLKGLYRSMAQCWLRFADEKDRQPSSLERSVDQQQSQERLRSHDTGGRY
jgi:hypothetical protein